MTFGRFIQQKFNEEIDYIIRFIMKSDMLHVFGFKWFIHIIRVSNIGLC